MPTKRLTPRRKGTTTPRIKTGRVEDPAHLARVRSLPCIACEIDGTHQDTPTESHHIRRDTPTTTYGKGQKAHDTETIPLCQAHHWNGVYCQDHGLTLAWFETYYGNERELLAKTLERLKVAA